MEITKQKFDDFTKLIGEGKVKEALGLAELTEKEAEELGISWKGDEPEEEEVAPETEAPEGEEPESEEEEIPGEDPPENVLDVVEKSLEKTLEPIGIQLKSVTDNQEKILDTQTSTKEVLANQGKAIKKLQEKVADLEGETPRSQKGYRPSQDDETIIDDDHSLKDVKPGIDPEFMGWLAPGGVQE